MKTLLVGFGGKAGAGKDTAADVLVKQYGFSKTGFAVSVKDACRSIFRFSDEQLYGDQTHKNTPDPFWGFSPRAAMQALGDTLRDRLDPDVWVRALERRVAAPAAAGFPIAVIDLRYENEANLIKKLGGILIRVDRPTSLSGVEATHRSESALDSFSGWDFIIDNTGTQLALEIAIHRIAANCGIPLVVPDP